MKFTTKNRQNEITKIVTYFYGSNAFKYLNMNVYYFHMIILLHFKTKNRQKKPQRSLLI